jgi:hypothetical protein
VVMTLQRYPQARLPLPRRAWAVAPVGNAIACARGLISKRGAFCGDAMRNNEGGAAARRRARPRSGRPPSRCGAGAFSLGEIGKIGQARRNQGIVLRFNRCLIYRIPGGLPERGSPRELDTLRGAVNLKGVVWSRLAAKL